MKNDVLGSSRERLTGLRAVLAFAVCLVLMVTANVLMIGSTAHAAAGTPISIDDVAFVHDEFDDGSQQEVTVKWSVPGEAANPVAVTIDLPEGLSGHEDRFAMLDPDGNAAGECVVSSSSVTCTVDPAYIDGHELDMQGEFNFRVNVWLENLETEERVFEFGDISDTVTVGPNPNRCFENCEFGGWGAWKSGSYQNLQDTISWWVGVPGGADGIPTGRDIVVEDQLDPSAFELIGTPVVYEARSLAYDSLGRQHPVFSAKPASEVTVSADGLRVEFTSVSGLGAGAPEGQQGIGGSMYQVVWTVKVLDEGKAKTYQNTAKYTIEGAESGATTGSATRVSGSGTVVGRNFGKFQLTKELAGDTSLTPEFTVNYTATLDGAVTEQRTIALHAGQSFLSEELFKGTTITLDEITPVDPSNVTWADPVFVLPDGSESERLELTFSSADRNLGAVTQIRLQNRATLQKSSLTAHKTVVNDDGMRIPEDTTFTLNYRWAADPAKGIPQGGGSIELPLDGERVEIPNLPIGAVVEFSESAPAVVPGATWQAPVIEPARVVVDETSPDVEVAVTNTLTRDFGDFEIVKRLDGNAAGLVDDPTFTVEWSYPADPERGVYEAGSGVVEVTAGGAATVVEHLPAGATVTLEEVLEKVEGGTWAEPVFSQKTFMVVAGNRITIDLDNELTLNAGFFSARKALDGTGAKLVPATDTFTIHYAYEAGIGFAAGEGDLVVAADGSVSTSSPLPYGAVLHLSELAPQPVLGGTWAATPVFSADTVTIGDGTTVDVELTNTITRDVGSFTLKKQVEGSGSHLVDSDREFTFTYEYAAGPSFDALEPTEVTVPADGTSVTVDDIPAGAVVTVLEVAPEAVVGGTWGAVQFAESNTFVIGKDEQTEVLAVNTLHLNDGFLSVRKAVTGSGASMLPADATFTVRYEYPAGAGFAGGAGLLTLSADGDAVTSEAIPFGAEVTLTELTPAAVEGASWAGAAFSEGVVVIGDGTVAEIVLTNTLERHPAAGLASTGVDGLVSAVAGGALVLALGAALLLMAAAARRRRA